MARGVNIGGLLSSYQQLAQANALKRQREDAEKAKRRATDAAGLRTIGTVAGAIIGGVAAGSVSGGMGAPAGALLGSQIGSTAGGILSSSQGNEPFPTQEVVSTGINAGTQYQNMQTRQSKADTEESNSKFSSQVMAQLGGTLAQTISQKESLGNSIKMGKERSKVYENVLLPKVREKSVG